MSELNLCFPGITWHDVSAQHDATVVSAAFGKEAGPKGYFREVKWGVPFLGYIPHLYAEERTTKGYIAATAEFLCYRRNKLTTREAMSDGASMLFAAGHGLPEPIPPTRDPREIFIEVVSTWNPLPYDDIPLTADMAERFARLTSKACMARAARPEKQRERFSAEMDFLDELIDIKTWLLGERTGFCKEIGVSDVVFQHYEFTNITLLHKYRSVWRQRWLDVFREEAEREMVLVKVENGKTTYACRDSVRHKIIETEKEITRLIGYARLQDIPRRDVLGRGVSDPMRLAPRGDIVPVTVRALINLLSVETCDVCKKAYRPTGRRRLLVMARDAEERHNLPTFVGAPFDAFIRTCSLKCFRRTKRLISKERQRWLQIKKAKEKLREVKSYLKKHHAVSPLPRAESKRGTISRTA